MAGRKLSAERCLPVVRWLQLGAVAAGMGVALAAAPAIAWADDGADASASEAANPAAPRAVAAKQAGPRSAAAGRHAAAPAPVASNRNRQSRASAAPVAPRAASAAPVAVVRRSATVASSIPSSAVAKAAADTASASAAISAGGGTEPVRTATPVLNFLNGLNAAVTTFATGLQDLLAHPGAPAEFVQAALLLVRRSFFDQLPTATAEAGVYGTTGEVDGRIVTTNSEGDALTYKVAQAPTNGAVQVTSDGQYTYTPADGFTGTDSFTIEVADPGVDLSNPAGTRVQSVQVSVAAPNVSAGATSGFDFYNFTGRTIQVGTVPSDVSGTTTGDFVHVGGTLHIEIPNRALNQVDIAVFSAGNPTQNWVLDMLATGTFVPGSAKCTQGNCTKAGNAVLLVDAPGTVWDFAAGDFTGKIVLNGLLSASAAIGAGVTLSYDNPSYSFIEPLDADFVATDQSAYNRDGSETHKFSVSTTVTSEASETSSWEFSGDLGGSVKGIVDAAVGAKYGVSSSATESKSFTLTREFNLLPYSYGTVLTAPPRIAVSGDLKGVFSGTTTDPGVTFWFRGVNYNYPDPSKTEPIYWEISEPYQPLDPRTRKPAPNVGFVIKDGLAWTDPSFPLDPVYSVSLSAKDGHQLITKAYVGATVASPEDFTRQATYTSSDPTVATVSASGYLLALKAGTTRITATYSWKIPNDTTSGTVSAFMDVTVV